MDSPSEERERHDAFQNGPDPGRPSREEKPTQEQNQRRTYAEVRPYQCHFLYFVRLG